MKYMFESFEEWAAMTGYVNKNHPMWNAFQIVWNMARTKMPKDSSTKEKSRKTRRKP